MKRLLTLVLSLVLLLTLFVGCEKECKHDWLEEDCENPKICDKCGDTKGKPLGHEWADATCTKPMNCKVCHMEEGEPLGHSPGDWESTFVDIVLAKEKFEKKCVVCNEFVDEKEESMTKLYEGDLFLFTPVEFSTRFDTILRECSEGELRAMCSDVSGLCSCLVYMDENLEGAILFENGNTAVYPENKNDVCITEMFIIIPQERFDNGVWIMYAILATCDPTMTVEDARVNLLAVTDIGKITVRGITYTFKVEGSSFILGAYTD